MGTFPNFSNIADYAQKKLTNRKNNPYAISKLNTWVRVTSGVSTSDGDGLTIVSNPNFKLFGAAGISSIYGNNKQSGTIGTTWNGGAVNSGVGQGYRPSPTIESIEVDEGAGNLSRKASFSIKCFTLEQMEIVTRYFQEPGFSIFLEWGWNTEDGVKSIVKELGSDTISKFNNFVEVNKIRQLSKGEGDNYLGFITGGGIQSENDTWTVQVNCTGFTELPSYLVNGDNAGGKKGEKPKPEKDYGNLSRSNLAIGMKRWMFAFNALPSSRKTIEIKNLQNRKDDSFANLPIASILNYINFDPRIADSINDKADGTALSRQLGLTGVTQTTEADADGNTEKIQVKIPKGTPLVDENKFIRFGTLMKILNERELKSLKIGGNHVSMIIHSQDCVVSAFPLMFSTDKSKLLIPNIYTPKFNFIKARESQDQIDNLPGFTTDCSIKADGKQIAFPYPGNIKNGVITEGYAAGKSVDIGNELAKSKKNWGLLDDLYVNFDFAAGVMDSTNITIKDALYQILNGMSSAVNDLWNFQILETQAPNDITTVAGVIVKKGDSITSIKEVNFTPEGTKPEFFKFNLLGTDSIFKDSSLQLDMSGAKMNQVIGSRLNTKINQETQPNIGKLYAEGSKDLILGAIYAKAEESKTDTTGGEQDEDEDALRTANYLNFLNKLGQYPKVHFTMYPKQNYETVERSFDVNSTLYIVSYDDKQLLKIGKGDVKKYNDVSILLPINFTFTIHGISGIKRGDRFGVIGIPKKYEKQGFFQVIGVKHSIQGMEWTTEVTGGYRNFKFEDTGVDKKED
jgi:hypothetical protein